MTMTVNCTAVNPTRTLTASSLLPAQLAIPARQSGTWSPLLLGGVVWRGFTHIRTHREVLRLLLRFPPYTEFLLSNPGFAYKYLTQTYLVRGFTVAERATRFLHHYRRLHSALPD